MELTKIELFSYEDRHIETTFDEDGAVAHTEVKASKGTVSYGLSTGELRVDNPDGTGFSLTVNPFLTNKALEWIQGNIKKAEEQDKIACQQRDQEHQERMKHLEAQTAEAQLRLEETKLRHEIKTVELQIELVEKQKELREAKAEAEKANEENEPA